jgi:putative modified peptide
MERERAAAELLERLMSDPAFRAAFRVDPARALREAGLPEVADQVGPVGPRKALETLEVRESRSSLAGAMMAAFVEGLHIAGPSEAVAASRPAAPAPIQEPPAPVHGSPAAIDAAGSASGSPGGSLSPDDVVEIAEQRNAGPQAGVAADAGAESDGPDGGGGDQGDGPNDSSGDENEPDENEPDESDSDSGDDGSDDDSDAPGEGSNGEDANDDSSDGDSSDNQDNPDTPNTPDSDGGDSGDSGDSGSNGDSGGDDSDDGDDSSDSGDSGDSSDSGDSGDSGDSVPLEAGGYPGDSASQTELARWMGAAAQKRGLPPELPVMAALTESGLQNLPGGDRDSVGFFQMRLGIWNKDAYAGYPSAPEKQLDWFLDQAQAVRAERVARGESVADPKQYGDWIADIERPAAQYRGRYQLNYDKAHELIAQAAAQKQSGSGSGSGAELINVMVDGKHAGPRALQAVADAEQQMGVPYKWGGSSPGTGFDCSGLVQYVYAKVGIRLPRVSEDQINAAGGTTIDRDHLLPGDLVFFRDSTGDVHHVGISLGGDKFINAPHSGANVRIDSLKESYFANEFAGGRRFDAADGVAVQAKAAAAAPPPVDDRAVQIAQAAMRRDAAEVSRPGTSLFQALERQERGKNQQVQFLPAVSRTA